MIVGRNIFPGAKKRGNLQIVKRLLVIGGPTASGKTATAVRLAQQLHTEILSGDSRQFYRGMAIGTAQPTLEEMQGVPHHFINFLDVHTPYTVGDFERDALELLEKLFERHDTVILCGGSGLFIRALCEGLDDFPEVTPEARQQVAAGEQQGGLAWLQDQVQLLDPMYFQTVDRQNPARLRRALEVCLSAHQPYSSFLAREKKPRPFEPVYLLLDWPRETLYARIDARVDQMVAQGLEAEARALLPYRHLPPLRTVGYEEFFDFFDGKISREAAIDKIKQHSRNYAKRQMTWFRKHGNWKRFLNDE
jgi:tRNA dimethylallyltransferase